LLIAERNKLQRELNEKYNSRELVKRTINGLKSELTDLQYHLLVVRQGGTNVDPSTVPSTGEYITTSEGFRNTAPSGSFGVFSIGSQTHRNGMSQWGAQARAESGQSYRDILNFYYSSLKFETGYEEPEEVKVKGEGKDCNNRTKYYNETVSFDTYMNRIFEMPASWEAEALKAQAVAARSYAIYKINTQGYLIPNQSNQVYKNCDNLKGWKDAVSATKGEVLTNGTTAALVQYASLHAGWVNKVGWDTTTGKGDYSGWMGDAWDSIAGHPWFYKMWYRYDSQNGYSDKADDCSRKPWLTEVEMADIVNAYQVWTQHNRSDSRIIPIYDACHSSGNPYSHSEMRKLANRPVSSISAVVTSSSNGTTNTITFYTNAGIISIEGADFKTVFNMRAPGHLMILQNGFVHINIEKN
jgi:hypothetical protein